jgi:hypothetical protein
MSRPAVAITLVSYLLIAVAFAAFMESNNPTPSIFLTGRIARVVGFALTFYALAGALPLLIWAIFRFKAARAQGPIVLWGVIGAILLYLNYLGETASRKRQIEAELPSTGLSAQGRADFIKNATLGCMRQQTASALNKEAGITAHQIDSFCICSAESLLDLTTIEELRYFAQNGSAPSGFEMKAQQAAAKCYSVIKLPK